MTFNLTCVYIILVQFQLLSGNLSHSFDNMFSHILTIFNITHVVIPRLGFEGWIKILIATVPDICILFEMPRRQRSANTVKAQCERRDRTVHAM